MSFAKMIEFFRKYEDDPEMQLINVINQYAGCFRNGELVEDKIKMTKGMEPPSDSELKQIYKMIRQQRKLAEADYGYFKRMKYLLGKIDEFEDYINNKLPAKQYSLLFKPARGQLAKTRASTSLPKFHKARTPKEHTGGDHKLTTTKTKLKV